jgi:WD40 repeat protein
VIIQQDKPFPYGEEHTLSGKHTGPVLVARFTSNKPRTINHPQVEMCPIHHQFISLSICCVVLLCCVEDSNYVLSGGRDRTIQLWNPHKGTHVKEYKGAHGYEVLDIAM